MKEAATEKFERIRRAHSLMHNPELADSTPVLRLLVKDTCEDLLSATENAPMSLPNLIYLGSKKDIKNRLSEMSPFPVTQPLARKTGKLVAVEGSSFLSAYFKNLYLQ